MIRRVFFSPTESYGVSGGLKITCGGRHYWLVSSGKMPLNGQPCACGDARWLVDPCGECGADKFVPVKKERP